MHRLRLAFCAAIVLMCSLLGAAAASASAVSEPAPSIFSVNTGTYDTSHANFVNDIPTAKATGARWVHFTEDSIHWSAGQPNFGTLDYEVSAARAQHLGVLVSLGGIPTACSVSPRPADPTQCPPTTSAQLSTYARFLKTVVLRYRSSVDTYESWLEPNGKGWWRPAPNPAQYARLLETQYGVFQSVNRTYGLHLKLIFGGPNCFSIIPTAGGSIAALPFVHEVLANLRGARAFDAIGLHAYRYPSANSGAGGAQWGPLQPEWDYLSGTFASQGRFWAQMTWTQELTDYEQEFTGSGYPNMPLWLTEFGWPGVANPSAWPAAMRNLYPSFASQAQWLGDAYRDILALPFVKAAFWFNLRDYQPGIASPDPAFFFHYGLLQYHFAAKPAGTEFKRLAAAHPGR